MLNRIEVASCSDPPDIETLTVALGGPDWFVAAIAADHINQLMQSERLEGAQANIAMQSLFKTLASGGHWWRFGWDKDEPEFEQFRSAAIEATSRFGPKAFPLLLAAAYSDNPLEREIVCWITLDMLKDATVDQATLAKQNILELVGNLAERDPNQNVKAACTFVQVEITKSVTKW